MIQNTLFEERQLGLLVKQCNFIEKIMIVCRYKYLNNIFTITNFRKYAYEQYYDVLFNC